MREYATVHEPNDLKLKELILFIARRSDCDERFGATKLNKLLFFADFLAYVKLGRSITGHEYQKLPKGPAPRKLKPLTNEMDAVEDFAWAERDRFGFTQKVPVALREADLSVFSAEEIAVVTEVIETFRSKNAKGISSLSHRFDGWKLAADRETIPFETALVRFARPRKRDIDKALAIREELAALRMECAADDGDP